MRARIEAIQRCDTRDLIVAERDGRVRGWIEVAIVDVIATDSYAEIHGLIVDEGERSGGLGVELVRAAEEWAVARGMNRIRVRSNVVRERARRFYEREGYVVTKTSNIFDKVLD